MFSKLKKLKGQKEGVLAWNTLMLYILTFSNYLLSLLIVPIEARRLTTETTDGYGMLGVAMAIMVYFQLFIDFGFILSATEEVSRHREDPKRLNTVLTAVTVCKLILCGLSFAVLVVLCQVIGAWKGKLGLYSLFFIGTAINALLPDYLYRGLEKMSAITIRTVCIRAFSTLGIWLFLKGPENLWVIPVLTAIGNFVAVFVCFVDAKKRLGVQLCRVSLSDVWLRMKQSSVFFLSRFATTAYSALNTVILDIVAPAASTVRGYYTSADKLMTTGKQALSPISDSLY
ncbi:MAG: oligosaccharide flippase family protein, partial [Oscillospiraceae bacterium]|nr:oligosaccharide flippase family protein [Oscillospiraceae bacterium]